MILYTLIVKKEIAFVLANDWRTALQMAADRWGDYWNDATVYEQPLKMLGPVYRGPLLDNMNFYDKV